jgi:outer membrane immunogenic protein
MKKILIATVAAIAMSGAASAADMSMPMKARPMPAPATNWTGCYVGAGAGYGLYNLREQTYTTATGAPTVGGINVGGEGWLAMGSIGCDYQFAVNGLGNWVIGAFGDGVGSNIHGNYTNNGFAGASGNMKESSEWDGGGRIGYLVTPTLLTYESVGYSSAHFSASTQNLVGGGFGQVTPSATYSGWFWGSGLEYQFTSLPIQGLFLKTEARFYSYGSKNLIDLGAGGAPNGFFDNVRPHVETVTTELVYRFNWH